MMLQHKLGRLWFIVGVLTIVYTLNVSAGYEDTADTPIRATLVVDSMADQPDSNPGDGQCVTASGTCTLRAAIQEANQNGGLDTIIVRLGTYSLSITGRNEDGAATGDLDITDDVIIDGAGENGTIISASQLDRVFDIMGGADVQISGVTISAGLSDGISSEGDGGGIRVLGANTMLTLRDSTVLNNRSVNWGGGIFIGEETTAALDKVVVEGNVAETLGGGIDNFGGMLTVMNSHIIGNRAEGQGGGGLFNDVSSITTIMTSTIDSNQSNIDGGGIYNFRGTTVGDTNNLIILNSTISRNTAQSNGGGIYNLGRIELMENMTLSGNDAANNGGGVYNQELIEMIDHGTIYGNDGREGGGLFNEIDSSITFKRSIIGNNTLNNCHYQNRNDGTSLGHNLESLSDCGFDQPTDTVNVSDLGLGALQDNGGGAETHMPSDMSIAIGYAETSPNLTVDQRGVARPQGDFPDAGAVEREMANTSIDKRDDPDPVYAATLITYTLTVANSGESPAMNVVVDDDLPPEVTFVRAVIPAPYNCRNVGSEVTCDISQLAVGQEIDIDMMVIAPDEGMTLLNGAEISAETSDPHPVNNTVSEETTVTPHADLAVGATHIPPDLAGEPLQYTIVVTNAGPSTAENITVESVLGAGVEFVSYSEGFWTCSYNETTSIVSCEVTTLLPFNQFTPPPLLLNVIAPPDGGQLFNETTITAVTDDLNLTNNTTDAFTTIIDSSDVAVVVESAPDPVFAHKPVMYTLQIDNFGPSVADNVIITSSLPIGAEYLRSTPNGWTCEYNSDSHQVVCEIDEMVPGGPSEMIAVVILATEEPTTMRNTVEITSDSFEPRPANNLFEEPTTVVASADLEVTISHAPEPVQAGSVLSYTASVENFGPSTASQIVLRYTVPDDVAITTVDDGSAWVCEFNNDLHQVTCSVDTLAPGLAPDVIIYVQAPDEAQTTVGEAEVSASTHDDDLSDNVATEDATVTLISDLSIVITDDPDPVDTDDLLIYNIAVTNHGPSRASNVMFTQTLPTDVTFDRALGEDWDCVYDDNFSVVTCERSLLAADTIATVDVTVRTPENVTIMTTTATVSSDMIDTVPENNTFAEDTYVNPANLVLEWDNPIALLPTGQRYEYVLKVTNRGRGMGLDTQVTVYLPEGTTYDDCTGAPCNYENGIIRYDLPSILAGEFEFITFKASADVYAHLVAEAWVQSPLVLDLIPVNNRIDIVMNTYRQYMPMLTKR